MDTDNQKLYYEVKAIIDDRIRPALTSDGGDIELVKVKGGNVTVRFLGACGACPAAMETFENVVKRLLKEALGNKISDITMYSGAGKELIDIARSFLDRGQK